MGAWSHEPFGNDDAADWLIELEDSKDLSAIKHAIHAVLDAEEEYLEAPESSSALAAAEILAALLGSPSASLPEKARTWVVGKSTPTSALLTKAKQAVSKILEASELQELWCESEDYPKWQAGTKGLLNRLG
jgi:hypothetical protein